MGKFKNGILGGFNGKVGNVVGATWKGITYMKAIQNTGNKKATQKQIIQRAKFGFAAQFLQPLYPVIQMGFKTLGVKQSAQNAAIAHLLNYAVTGEYPAFAVDYDNLYLAKGSLKVNDSASIEIVDGRIAFNWIDTDKALQIHGQEQALLIGIANGYYPTYSIDEYTREERTGSIAFPNAPTGSLVHCYIAFAESEGMQRASNSVYLGTVSIP
ncbi:DUF6266 family protein [Plebeiibacterium marinum]|uniref:DUF6266 family protein n=1 Tax=Plebeiibacterium marinum TaxID=2992111 RepID=A0AAE3MIN4_9BACT|nr:DUF6266 family protein [Plebeiobacterium marinum]MCW3808035.1 DUF6266 family protein [Plebeiobacterium marinum]